jgi:type I restriction-modification system DNA methylase subunit
MWYRTPRAVLDMILAMDFFQRRQDRPPAARRHYKDVVIIDEAHRDNYDAVLANPPFSRSDSEVTDTSEDKNDTP